MLGKTVVVSTNTGDVIGKIVKIGYPSSGYIVVKHEKGTVIALESDIKQVIA